MTNTKQLTIQILENLEAIDCYLLDYGTSNTEEATSLWNETLPLIQSLPKQGEEPNEEIQEHLKQINQAVPNLESDESAWISMEIEISNLASTILNSTPNMEEWQIVYDEEDPEIPFQLVENERVIELQEKVRELEGKNQENKGEEAA